MGSIVAICSTVVMPAPRNAASTRCSPRRCNRANKSGSKGGGEDGSGVASLGLVVVVVVVVVMMMVMVVVVVIVVVVVMVGYESGSDSAVGR